MKLSLRLLQSFASVKCNFSAEVLQSIERYAGFDPFPLSLQAMVEFGSKTGTEKKSFLFLRKEVPVRLANIMKEINLLPDQLLSMPSVQLVESWYEQSFQEILKYEKTDPQSDQVLQDFNDALVLIRNRHATVVETMAQGVLEMKESQSSENPQVEHNLQYFLDRFYMSRIGIRMLINQHVLLYSKNAPVNLDRHIGSIDPFCDVVNVAQDAFENARFLCESYYMNSPGCQFISHNHFEKDAKISMVYVPAHLYHILFELFKNSLRAVVEFHGEKGELPPLNVMIAKGKEDVTIKITDQGGGIPRSYIDKLFKYLYSTAPRPPSPQAASYTPLAGYGYGLPLSRLYAKYFNGDLTLSSVEGYGTDALVHLKVFPSDASELLPIFNKTASKVYTNAQAVSDWSDHQVSHSRFYSTCSRLSSQSRS